MLFTSFLICSQEATLLYPEMTLHLQMLPALEVAIQVLHHIFKHHVATISLIAPSDQCCFSISPAVFQAGHYLSVAI